jgi:hypothetical protein
MTSTASEVPLATPLMITSILFYSRWGEVRERTESQKRGKGVSLSSDDVCLVMCWAFSSAMVEQAGRYMDTEPGPFSLYVPDYQSIWSIERGF